MRSSADFLIIGAGVVGVAIGRELLKRRPKTKVAVLEKEHSAILHSSLRNSGVVHAGFYYSPDSVKAKLTRRGNGLLREFISLNGIEFKPAGKVVVARSELELSHLDELYFRAKANSVDVEIVDEKDLAKLEPMARTVTKALWSPTTWSASPAQVGDALVQDFLARGGTIHFNEKVTRVNRGSITTESGSTYSCGHLINSAGMQADRIAKAAGLELKYTVLPFKGIYLIAPTSKNLLTRHIYPVPDMKNPFLGVHYTVRYDGAVKVGPTAIPALWREDYGGLAGFNARDVFETLVHLPRFLRAQVNESRRAVYREVLKYWRPYLLREARQLAPQMPSREFSVRGNPGVRAQLVDKASGKLAMDFIIHDSVNATHLLNTVSPGWTSSLAIAEHLADRLGVSSERQL